MTNKLQVMMARVVGWIKRILGLKSRSQKSMMVDYRFVYLSSPTMNTYLNVNRIEVIEHDFPLLKVEGTQKGRLKVITASGYSLTWDDDYDEQMAKELIAAIAGEGFDDGNK